MIAQGQRDETRVVPLRPVRLGPRGNILERRPDGSLILRHPDPLLPYPRSYTERLAHWAERTPSQVFLADRFGGSGWRTVTYGEAWASVQRLSQAMLRRKLSAERPLAILSGNSIEHALLALAAMHVGVPYAPISVSFSLLSRDYAKLVHVLGLLQPGLVFVQELASFEKALCAALLPKQTEIVFVSRGESVRAATSYADLLAEEPSGEVDSAARAVTGDTVAKILFTSGSSAMPKGALNTHRMLCANQQMGTQAWPFLQEAPPLILDWLPWNHTFGGNFIFGLNLYHGGSLYIDDGKAMPGEIDKSVRNLREIAPTLYFGIPKTYEMLLPWLEQDDVLRRSFFSRMQMIFYAAAGLPQTVWDALRALSIDTLGERIFTCTTLGSTETGPLAITANWDADRPNILGLPVPGCELKLVPNDRKIELRVRGPSITPGYLKEHEKTVAAFDDDGWYCMGDAVRLFDPADVDQGLVFDGRIAEDYKLSTGTWVNGGLLRTMVNSHLSPLVRDVLPVGHNRAEVGVLAFPEFEICRRFAGLDSQASRYDIIMHPRLREEFGRRLSAIAAEGTSSANTVTRLMLVEEPLRDVECTDKGTLSFNVVLERRAAEVETLYASEPSPRAVYLPNRAA